MCGNVVLLLGGLVEKGAQGCVTAAQQEHGGLEVSLLALLRKAKDWRCRNGAEDRRSSLLELAGRESQQELLETGEEER